MRKVPYGGLYEVTGAGEVFYTDEKTTFLVLGSVIDTKTRENITESRCASFPRCRSTSCPSIPRSRSCVAMARARSSIFEDPNCGYCKQFERDLAGITDVTIYVMLYPILSPESMVKSKAIWCSADKGKAWMDYMLKQPRRQRWCVRDADRQDPHIRPRQAHHRHADDLLRGWRAHSRRDSRGSARAEARRRLCERRHGEEKVGRGALVSGLLPRRRTARWDRRCPPSRSPSAGSAGCSRRPACTARARR